MGIGQWALGDERSESIAIVEFQQGQKGLLGDQFPFSYNCYREEQMYLQASLSESVLEDLRGSGL